MKHGQGTFFGGGFKYVGEWKNDKKDGQGTMFYGHGDKYVGEWKNGAKHGQGILTFHTGEYVEQLWKDGLFLKLSEESQKAQEKRIADIKKAKQTIVVELQKLKDSLGKLRYLKLDSLKVEADGLIKEIRRAKNI